MLFRIKWLTIENENIGWNILRRVFQAHQSLFNHFPTLIILKNLEVVVFHHMKIVIIHFQSLLDFLLSRDFQLNLNIWQGGKLSINAGELIWVEQKSAFCALAIYYLVVVIADQASALIAIVALGNLWAVFFDPTLKSVIHLWILVEIIQLYVLSLRFVKASINNFKEIELVVVGGRREIAVDTVRVTVEVEFFKENVIIKRNRVFNDLRDDSVNYNIMRRFIEL